MPRKPRRPRRRNETDLPDCFIEFFKTGKKPESGEPGALELFMLRGSRSGELPEIWKQERASILTSWRRTKPGTRPFAWWMFDSPEPKQRTSGQGRPEYPAIKPLLEWGIPKYFDEISETDPPKFESEAAYLKRYGLLTKPEEKRLSGADFEPETIS